ncbi:MAG: type II toxin-antitoxin system RelE/ParE family toxin [Lachnospiraceae bacterium]|nr:type II toxin-antitoxin system RelE/ParE family toxin [Lachnospiraceae bacterium]
MKKLEFSPLVRNKLRRLKLHLLSEYGDTTAIKILRGIIEDAEKLMMFDEIGTDISKLYDLDTEYWYLFTHQHYLIFRREKKKVIIVQIFHEREDFMMKLFGISGRTQESIDYWGD